MTIGLFRYPSTGESLVYDHVKKGGFAMYIVIGADHRGFHLKQSIMEQLEKTPDHKTISWIDVGCQSDQHCDYPEISLRAVTVIKQGQAALGVLLCGTGVGMTIAANRFSGIYAGLAWNEEIGRLNREHDNVNILVLPADYISSHQACTIINAWLGASFSGLDHKKRIEQIDAFGGL